MNIHALLSMDDDECPNTFRLHCVHATCVLEGKRGGGGRGIKLNLQIQKSYQERESSWLGAKGVDNFQPKV